jgi:hypothetical protein
MATKVKTETAALRRCIGSARYGIEPHEAPSGDFPVQPSQKDGLGRLCRQHWQEYTRGLARDAKARKAAEGATVAGADAPGADDTAPARSPAAGKRRRIASTAQGNRYAEPAQGA